MLNTTSCDVGILSTLEIGNSTCMPVCELFRPTYHTEFAVYSISMFSGLLCNFPVLLAIVSAKKIRTKPYLFVLSITFAHILASLVIGPLKLVQGHGISGDVPQWLRLCACKLTRGMAPAVQLILSFSITLIAVERYVIVCYPFRAKRFWTRRTCRILISISWFLAIVCCIAFCYFYTVTDFCTLLLEEGELKILYWCEINEMWDQVSSKIYFTLRLILFFFIPMLITSFCYVRVILTLWRSSRAGGIDLDLTHTTVKRLLHQQSVLSYSASQLDTELLDRSASTRSTRSRSAVLSSRHLPVSRNESGASEIRNPYGPDFYAIKRRIQNDVGRSRQRIMKLLVCVFFAFVLCWGPDLTYEWFRAIFPWTTVEGQNLSILNAIDIFNGALCVFHSTIDPLLFLLFSRDFRKALQRLCINQLTLVRKYCRR